MNAGFPTRNVRTKQFRERYEKLPERIQNLAVLAFREFKKSPESSILHNHPLDDTRRGHHRKNSFSVWVNQAYRAIYVIEDNTVVWYWIGSHSDYNIFTGKKGKK